MTTQHAMLPQMEAPTADAMSRVVSMFATLTNKHLTPEEGYQFLSLWGMVNKTAASAAAMNPATAAEPAAAPAPAPAAAVPAAPAAVLPSAPVSAAQSLPAQPVPAAAAAAAPVAAEPAPAPAPALAAQPEHEAMPAVEEIAIPGVQQPLRRLMISYRSKSKFWTPGYNWRIDVIPFDRDNTEDAYHVHFRNKPTQAEFDEHYARFLDKENRCKVHILESDGSASRRITDEYCSFRENSELNYHTRETLQPTAEWEEGARFRVRFSDRRINGKTNYIYYPNRPTQAQIDGISFAKGCVIVETRPKQ